MTPPLVSILVVSYNQEDYIGQTLDCLLTQDCPFNYEILIGEDCSTDRTRDICKEYAEKYPDKIRLFLNTQNKGLINNYFDLMEKARGRYLADCGGDDYWIAPDKLSRQVAILEQHPTVTMVGGNWQLLHQKNGLIEPNQSGKTEDWFDPSRFGKQAVIDYLNKKNFPPVVLSTACFRADLLKGSMQAHPDLFRGKDVICEDLPITLCLLIKGPFYLMKDELIVYRMLEKSVSHSDTLDGVLKGFSHQAFRQTMSLAKSLGISSNGLKPYLGNVLPDFIYYAFIKKDRVWLSQLLNDLQEYHIKLPLKQQLMVLITHGKLVNQLLVYLNQFVRNNNSISK
ncbi:MAG: glycosyltransferase [Bacteroidota bacterium]|nr:glycosyltransferase [Bacteroidota bacterium]